MRKNRSCFIFLALLIFTPTWVCAQTPQQQEIDLQEVEVIEKASYLKNLINNLLLTPNASSIQETIKNTHDEKVMSLINKAMEAKASGEKLFNDKKYFEALVDFQTSLECILQAIRESKSPDEEEQKTKAGAEEKLKSNEYFISTAARILNENEGNTTEPGKLLEMAKAARAKAEAKMNEGKTQEALEELENSTSLAKRAIISVRNGKVIERKSPGTPGAGGHP